MHTLFYLPKLFVLSSAFEEVLHKCSAFLLQDAACYSCFGMENVGRELMEAPLFIACSIYDTWNLCPSDGTGTHGTRLYRYV